MTIHIDKEKQLTLSSQDIYDICDFSTQAAYDNGFMNSFIFERALYVFAAIRLYPDFEEELTKKAASNINDAWSYLLSEDIVDNMTKEYSIDCDIIAECGQIWFEDYSKYALSARGLLDNIQLMTGNIVDNAAQLLKESANENAIQEVLQKADEWGMNNKSELVESVFEE